MKTQQLLHALYGILKNRQVFDSAVLSHFANSMIIKVFFI